MFDFLMNAVLFSDDVISQKYNNKGEISLVTTYTLSIVSNIISYLLSLIVFKLTHFAYLFEFIEQELANPNKNAEKYNKIVSKVKCRLYVFFIIMFPITMVVFYYLVIFCNVYSASQKNWFTNSVTSLFISLLTSIAMSLLITIFRYIGLKCRSEKAYNISLYLNK